jgi:hypothetical protein
LFAGFHLTIRLIATQETGEQAKSAVLAGRFFPTDF